MKLSEFDFRIWDNTEKRYLNEIELHKYDRSPVEAGTTFTETDRINEVEFVKNKNDLEIELWTGLYDKGGVKIFAGDILNFRGKNYLVKMNKELKTIIICESKDSAYIMYISKGNLKECKVIGNIHENKELLK